MQSLWTDPSDITYDRHDAIGIGTSSMVYRGEFRGSPAAIKVYHIPLGQAGGAAGIDQLMTGILRRELCIIARAQGFHHVCRSVQITGMGSQYSKTRCHTTVHGVGRLALHGWDAMCTAV